MKSEPERQHQWLQKFVGEWTYDGEAVMDPSKPPETFSGGTESVRAVGPFWVVGEARGTMPDGNPSTAILTLGFDPRSQRFVGSWIGSMMSHFWVYDGALDEATKTLTLEAEGPGFKDQTKTSLFRDVFTFDGEDHRILTASVRDDDGNWTTFMRSHYRRVR